MSDTLPASSLDRLHSILGMRRFWIALYFMSLSLLSSCSSGLDSRGRSGEEGEADGVGANESSMTLGSGGASAANGSSGSDQSLSQDPALASDLGALLIAGPGIRAFNLGVVRDSKMVTRVQCERSPTRLYEETPQTEFMIHLWSERSHLSVQRFICRLAHESVTVNPAEARLQLSDRIEIHASLERCQETFHGHQLPGECAFDLQHLR